MVSKLATLVPNEPPPPIELSTASNLLSTDWEYSLTLPIPVIVDELIKPVVYKSPAIFTKAELAEIIELLIWSSPLATGTYPAVKPVSFPNEPVFLGPAISLAEAYDAPDGFA